MGEIKYLSDSGAQNLITEIKNRLSGKQNVIQYSIMPVASAENLNSVVQYIGTTTALYINGYFYRCVSNGDIDPIYVWEPIYPIWTGTRAEHTAAEQANRIPNNALIGITDEA